MFKQLNSVQQGFRSLFPKTAKKGITFLSFDVEALLIRASEDHVNRLIWGKTTTGEYGIRRLSGILRQYGLKGNFLIDLAACHIHGDKPVREIFDFLLSEGHEVHAHMHPEMLAESWKLERTGVRARRFDDLGQFLTVSLLTYAAMKFRIFAQRDPYLFRSGSYLFNRHTVEGAREAGFSALSNFQVRRHDAMVSVDSPARTMNPFQWDNGIYEIPVDISSPEKLSLAEIRRRRIRACNKEERTFNLVSHSWSLLQRDAVGHFTEFVPKLEERFHQMCNHLAHNSQVMGYEEYLVQHPPKTKVDGAELPSIVPFHIKRAKRCEDCFAIMSPDVLQNNQCKNCGSLRIVDFNRSPLA